MLTRSTPHPLRGSAAPAARTAKPGFRQRWRTLLKWKEPREFLRVVHAEARRREAWWAKPAWSMAITLVMMVNWFLARQDPTKTPPPFPAAFGVTLLGAMFLVHVLPLLYRLDRPAVRVRGWGIHYTHGNGGTLIDAKTIARCEIVPKRRGGQMFRFLRVHQTDGTATDFALDDATDDATLVAALGSIGVRIEPVEIAEQEDAEPAPRSSSMI